MKAHAARVAHPSAPDKDASIRRVTARAYRIPTQRPEADGTLEWTSTNLIVAEVEAGGVVGIGYSYAGAGCVRVIADTLVAALEGLDILDMPLCWQRMCTSVRNLGRSGETACAIAAVDNALWDAKAKYLALPLITLLGAARPVIPVYGSGGFTNLTPDELKQQIESWRGMGIRLFKIKIGRGDMEDERRLQAAGDLTSGEKLFVDANGAYNVKEALTMADKMTAWKIAWFEEPVSSDDRNGLRFVRDHAPACMQIAAGEYAYNTDDVRALLEYGAVDALQADATRCQGISGFLKAAALAEAYHLPLSSHCAPALHVDVMCHAATAVHMEYFWDHMRIEDRLFDGAPCVKNGQLAAQTERPGFGLVFRHKDAEAYAL